jgi:hypothetical protein
MGHQMSWRSIAISLIAHQGFTSVKITTWGVMLPKCDSRRRRKRTRRGRVQTAQYDEAAKRDRPARRDRTARERRLRQLALATRVRLRSRPQRSRPQRSRLQRPQRSRLQRPQRSRLRRSRILNRRPQQIQCNHPCQASGGKETETKSRFLRARSVPKFPKRRWTTAAAAARLLVRLLLSTLTHPACDLPKSLLAPWLCFPCPQAKLLVARRLLNSDDLSSAKTGPSLESFMKRLEKTSSRQDRTLMCTELTPTHSSSAKQGRYGPVSSRDTVMGAQRKTLVLSRG